MQSQNKQRYVEENDIHKHTLSSVVQSPSFDSVSHLSMANIRV